MRAVIALLLILINAHSALAQVEISRTSLADNFSYSKVWFNVGVAASNTSTPGKDRNIGAFFGVEYEAVLVPAFSFQTGLNYTQKGYDSFTIGTDTYTYDYLKLDYLEIPLLAKAKLGTLSRVTFELGGYFGYAIRRSATRLVNTGTASNPIPGVPTSPNVGNQVKAYDIGARAGVGLEIPVGQLVNLAAKASYDWGLIDVGTAGSSYPGKNRSLLIQVAFGFPFDALALSHKL